MADAAWCGVVRRGEAGYGEVRRGAADVARHGRAGLGEVRKGRARLGGQG